MQLSYKSVYHLLEKYFTRRSLNGLIEGDISDDIFNASLLFAKAREDYKYLKTMVNDREHLHESYVLFMTDKPDVPIILPKDKSLTLMEFAALHVTNPSVPLHEFQTVVEAQSIGKGQDPAEELTKFNFFVETLSKDDGA